MRRVVLQMRQVRTAKELKGEDGSMGHCQGKRCKAGEKVKVKNVNKWQCFQF
jgi:hypothetical protein